MFSSTIPWTAVPLAYLAAITVPLAVTDARTLRLPNALVVPGLVLLAWSLIGLTAEHLARGIVAPPSKAASAFGRAATSALAAAAFGSADARSALDAGAAPASAGLGPTLEAGVIVIALAMAGAAGAIGMGDVKLATLLVGLAAASDPRLLPQVALATGVLTAAQTAAAIICWSRAPSARVLGHRLPLGPALLGGFWSAMASTLLPHA
ncbi:hypothetical protein [Herbiconiux daphne]|uniref:Prepilin type IV endopeptidase peptidase domain-containing protein n=1 Tax=Herbiconiux daphne TaxID=2970914 RepID=A0ABT2H2S3_9MICO|nr:hypothetical protein [Herbiconiux daphne]MCS5734241.1 hypothetical protein [Herbiconiux daphne]